MSVAVGDVFALWPGFNRVSSGITNTSTATVDDGSEKVATILQVARAGQIEYVGLCISAATHPTANVDIRVETVSTTTGNPTGTLFGSNTNWSGSWSSGSYRIEKWGPLTSNASVSQGNLIAIVYTPPANPDAGSVDFGGANDEQYGFPYTRFYNGASWVTTSARVPICLWYTDGYSVIPGMPQIGNMFNYGVNSTDTYNHIGLEMKSNVAMEIVGMWAQLDLNTYDATLKLISGGNTVERTATIESDYAYNSDSQNLYYGYFSSPFQASADVLYRYVVYTASTSDIALVCPRTAHIPGDDEMTQQLSTNWFYDIDLVEGELTTPTWQEYAAGAAAWGLIGPIVRSIG